MIGSGDAACLAALAARVGHAPPFSGDELALITSLTITHARDLTPIRGCTDLAHLRIVASELDDLDALSDLAALEHLEIQCTKLGSMLGANPAKLARIDLLFTSVRQAVYLLGTEHWKRGTLVGNPWEDRSWSALTNELEHGRMLVDCSSTVDWHECCQLWERLGACSGELAGDYGLLVRPGIPTLTENIYDALQVVPGTGRSALREPDMTIEKLFSRYARRVEAPDLSRLNATRILGSSRDVLQWIHESSLSAEDKAALERFVNRFPTVVFYRATEAAIRRTEKAFDRALTSAHRALRETLDGWSPRGARPPVRFDRFERWSPREEAVGSMSYQLGLREHGADTRQAMRAAGFTIVGLSVESPQSTLAIRDDDDPAVYEYSEEDVLDALSENRDVRTSIRPVFRSYAAMLGHIVAILPSPPSG